MCPTGLFVGLRWTIAAVAAQPQTVGNLPNAILSRGQLANIDAWTDSTAVLLVPPDAGSGSRRTTTVSKRVLYRRSSPLELLALTILADPRTGYTYVASPTSFYVANDSELLAVTVGVGVTIQHSYFAVRATSKEWPAVVSSFASSLGDNMPVATIHAVPMTGLPRNFFIRDSREDSSQGAPASLEEAELIGTIMRLRLLSSGGRFDATLWIDLDTILLNRAVVDGTEVFAAATR